MSADGTARDLGRLQGARREHPRSGLTALREAHVTFGHLTCRAWEAKPTSNAVAGPKIGRAAAGICELTSRLERAARAQAQGTRANKSPKPCKGATPARGVPPRQR